jgi:hypothetical protein
VVARAYNETRDELSAAYKWRPPVSVDKCADRPTREMADSTDRPGAHVIFRAPVVNVRALESCELAGNVYLRKVLVNKRVRAIKEVTWSLAG